MQRIWLGAALAGLFTGAPAAAEDWFRAQQAPDWYRVIGPITIEGAHYAIVAGLPGAVEGNVTVAAIPRDGPIQWMNYMFDCKNRIGRIMQVWSTDRKGVSQSSLASTGEDYAPIDIETLDGQIFALTCNQHTLYWQAIEGDVLAAADEILASGG
jgi:hypothetical protein